MDKPDLARELLEATREFVDGIKSDLIKAMWILVAIMAIILILGLTIFRV